MLITEPEAAALYCATLCKEVDLKIGNRFLICDAGGGTVVHTPESLNPLDPQSEFTRTPLPALFLVSLLEGPILSPVYYPEFAMLFHLFVRCSCVGWLTSSGNRT